MDDVALTEIVGLVYEAAISPDRWADLLQRLARGFDCHFCAMKITSANREEFRGIAVGVDRAEHQDFLRRFNRTNPISLRLPSGLVRELIEACSVITRAELERSEMYQAFFARTTWVIPRE